MFEILRLSIIYVRMQRVKMSVSVYLQSGISRQVIHSLSVLIMIVYG